MLALFVTCLGESPRHQPDASLNCGHCYYIARSHTVLVRAILAMLFFRTLAIVGQMYSVWFGFIKQGDSPASTVMALEYDKGLLWTSALMSLACIFNVAIVDFIMVC
jgi:hypothetical protein